MERYLTYDGPARSSRAHDAFVTFNTHRLYACPVSHVTYTDDIALFQSSAEAALELNGTDMDDGHKLSVYISNPERKKERTDSDANDREVYVAGLSKFVAKEDLEGLFKTVSATNNYCMLGLRAEDWRAVRCGQGCAYDPGRQGPLEGLRVRRVRQ